MVRELVLFVNIPIDNLVRDGIADQGDVNDGFDYLSDENGLTPNIHQQKILLKDEFFLFSFVLMKIRIQPKSPDPTLRKTRIRIRYNFGFIKIRIQPKSPDPILRKPLIGIRFNFRLIKNRIQPTSPDPPLRETRIRISF